MRYQVSCAKCGYSILSDEPIKKEIEVNVEQCSSDIWQRLNLYTSLVSYLLVLCFILPDRDHIDGAAIILSSSCQQMISVVEKVCLGVYSSFHPSKFILRLIFFNLLQVNDEVMFLWLLFTHWLWKRWNELQTLIWVVSWLWWWLQRNINTLLLNLVKLWPPEFLLFSWETL